ncbi:MAG: YitT family protein [Desulfobacterales bacterium]|nr:YitT family protein [Deltaproteobacteria bacterium]NNL75305.1 YitT family protein [Desulfobacterales bacterium]
MIPKIQTFFVNINFRKVLPDYFLLSIGAIILAVNFDIFLAPFNIAPGGVSGLAIIIHEFTGWPQGLTMLALTVPILIIGFFHLGRFRFLIRAFYVTLIYSLGVDVLATFLPSGVTNDLLLNALYAGIFGGIGIGLIYRGGTSPAGTSVISRILQLKTGIPNSQVYIFIDGGVILIAGLVFGGEMALYAFVTLFMWGLVADYVLEGPSVVRTAFIVTDAPEEVSRVLLDRMSVGVTGWVGKGMFSKNEHSILFCAVNRPDVNILKSLVNDADPRAFVVIAQGQQARGGTLRQTLRHLNRLQE